MRNRYDKQTPGINRKLKENKIQNTCRTDTKKISFPQWANWQHVPTPVDLSAMTKLTLGTAH